MGFFGESLIFWNLVIHQIIQNWTIKIANFSIIKLIILKSDETIKKVFWNKIESRKNMF